MSELQRSDFRVTISQPLQWGEQDGLGHINNMHYIRWFESARIAYLLKLGVQISNQGVGPILAAVSCNFRRQLSYPDTVIVGAQVTRIGRSSMSMKHGLWSEASGSLAAEGDSTVVMFDYQKQKPSPIEESLRTAIQSLEGRPLAD